MAVYSTYKVLVIPVDDLIHGELNERDPIVNIDLSTSFGHEAIEDLLWSAMDHMNVCVTTVSKELDK